MLRIGWGGVKRGRPRARPVSVTFSVNVESGIAPTRRPIMTPRFAIPLLPLLLLVACGGGSKPQAGCGIAALAGPTMLLTEFGTPGQTLGFPPDSLPPRLVARVVAGPALPAIVGRADSAWVIGVEGTLPPAITPGFGVLIMNTDGAARGVLIYEGSPISQAPILGSVTIQDRTVPLLGIQLDAGKYEDPRCPVFPDSILP